MAKNTNPITKGLPHRGNTPITWHASKNIDLYHDIMIKKLIHGVLLRFNYITSEIIISRSASGHIEISFGQIKIPNSLDHGPRPHDFLSPVGSHASPPMVKLLKSILYIKFGGSYSFKIIQVPNIFTSPKLVADYINIELTKDPRQHRYVFQRLYWDFLGLCVRKRTLPPHDPTCSS